MVAVTMAQQIHDGNLVLLQEPSVAELLTYFSFQEFIEKPEQTTLVLFYHSELCDGMHDPIRSIDSVAEVFFDAPEEYANIAVAAVDCASPSGVGVCKWLNVLNYPGYLIFTGEDRRFYQYLEHHWTEFGDGDELSNEMVQFLKNEHYKLQPSFPIPVEGLGMINTAMYAIESEAHVVGKEHPFGLAFVVGSVSGAVLIAIYGLARRQLYHLFASAGPTVVMGKGSKKGFTF